MMNSEKQAYQTEQSACFRPERAKYNRNRVSMNKKQMKLMVICSLALVFSLAAHFSAAAEESLSFRSGILEKDAYYSVYLPPGYEGTARSYPVIYALHGDNGNENTLLENGYLDIVDRLIESGQIPPVIIVMPDGGRTRYINNFDNSVRYEDFFFDELIPEVESRFRISASRTSRAVTGISMGGYGSIVYALKHPDMFAASVSIGGSFCEGERIESMTNEQWNNSTRGSVYGMDLDVQERLTDHYKAHDPCFMLENIELDDLATLGLYIDCGDDDFRNDGNARFHMLMRKLSVAHEYRVGDGAHDLEYFAPRFEQGLLYIASRFGN